MTLSVELTPEAEAELMKRSSALGVDVRAYAAHLLEEEIMIRASATAPANTPPEPLSSDISKPSDKGPLITDGDV